MGFSHYEDRDLSRLKNEAQAGDKTLADRIKALEKRMSDAEFFERWVRETLYPYLVAFAAFAGYTAPPEPPP